MRGAFFGIIFLLIAVGLWRLSALPPPLPVSEIPHVQPSLRPSPLSKLRSTPRPVVSRGVPEEKREVRSEGRGNVVEFKIIDGFAVAYGDLILGRPDGAMSDTRGWAEVAAPQYWSHPEIAYNIHPDLPQPERVEKALAYLREKTPVRFVPYTGQKDVVQFEVGTEHCLSLLGKVGGVQPIRLSGACQWQEVLHEVLHTLGFIHEQSRTDRDQYIEVLWKNIDPEFHDQFAMVPDSFGDAVRGFAFDYHSVMLYSTEAFALEPGLKSLQSRTAEAIGPVKDGLSAGDIKRLNRMFRGYE